MPASQRPAWQRPAAAAIHSFRELSREDAAWAGGKGANVERTRRLVAAAERRLLLEAARAARTSTAEGD